MIQVTFKLKTKSPNNFKEMVYYVSTHCKLTAGINALREHIIKTSEVARKYKLTGERVRRCYREPECLDIELLSGEL